MTNKHWSQTEKREEVLQKISVGWKNLIPKKKLGEYRKCLICGTEKYWKRAYILSGRGKFCSKKCSDIFKKSIPEEKHANWKGDGVGYYGVHTWMKKHYGSAKKCEKCGTIKSVQWANISREYHRDRADFIELCASCHKKFDLEYKDKSR